MMGRWGERARKKCHREMLFGAFGSRSQSWEEIQSLLEFEPDLCEPCAFVVLKILLKMMIYVCMVILEVAEGQMRSLEVQ